MVAALLAFGVGCGDAEEPQSQGPSDATFTAPGTVEPATAAKQRPQCPKAGKPVTGAAKEVRVADLRDQRKAAPESLQTAREIVVECIRWKGWGASRTAGTGVARVLDCEPTCASGQLTHHRARIELVGRRRCNGRQYYLRATLRLTNAGDRATPVSFIKPPCVSAAAG